MYPFLLDWLLNSYGTAVALQVLVSTFASSCTSVSDRSTGRDNGGPPRHLDATPPTQDPSALQPTSILHTRPYRRFPRNQTMVEEQATMGLPRRERDAGPRFLPPFPLPPSLRFFPRTIRINR